MKQKQNPSFLHLAIVLLVALTSPHSPVGAKSLQSQFGSRSHRHVGNSYKTEELLNGISDDEDNKVTGGEGERYEKDDYLGGGSMQACEVVENEPLHAIMDKVCELCHDFYSHQFPNMRVDCRADCFRTESFKKCLRVFSPRALRKSRMARI